jgi:hypothetical protein
MSGRGQPKRCDPPAWGLGEVITTAHRKQKYNFTQLFTRSRNWTDRLVQPKQWLSSFGGLGVACCPLVPKFAGSNPAEAVGFFGRKTPQYGFLRKGSKAVCPMSCFTTWKSPLSAKFLDHFSPIFPPSAAGFASVASDARGLLWRKLERSKSLVLLQVEGLTCCWQRHSIKPSC